MSELIGEILARREEQVEQALDALRLQYPGYAEALERRFIRNIALNREELEYDQLQADRLVGPELHRALRRGLAARRQAEEVRPPLDMALHNRDILREAPLFRDMDTAALDSVAEALVPVFVSPGDVVMRRGDVAEAVFFIASGAVEVEWATGTMRLGRGDMFGELGVMTRRPRLARVKAIGYSTLLRLGRERFFALMETNAVLREHVERTMAERRQPPLTGRRRADLPA